jgi:hypothetical protein
VLQRNGGENVYAVKDANFDMDIDPNFSEASSIFYDKLGHDKEKVTFLKRPNEAA